MTERVRALDQKLEQLLVGMRRIAEEYANVEELNRADAQRLRSLLTTSRTLARSSPSGSGRT
jgi:hypothetical protein